MASNLTEITNAIEGLNVTYEGINTTDVLNNAISSTNESSGGWIGIFVFAIMVLTIMIHIIKNKNSFYVFERTTLLLITLSISLDVGFYLFQFGILQSLQLLMFTFVSFFVIGVASFMKKEIQSPEN